MSDRRRRQLHLKTDYGAAGVWDNDGAPLDPAKILLSPKLKARIARWGGRFHKSFETEIGLDAFAAEGRAIARAVKAELPTWFVVYFDEAAAARPKYKGTPATCEVEIP